MPLVDSELVTYQNIRKACGGDAGLTIGYWLAVTPIGIANQKGYGSIRVRGVDYLGAISNTQGFLKLLTQDIYVGDPTPSFLTECHASDVADGNDQILSEYTVYPNNVVITSSTVKQSTQSKTGSNGKAVTKVATSKLLPIWSDVEPPGFTSGLSSFLAKLT